MPPGHEQPFTCQTAGGDGQCHGCGQRQRTGATDDQHGHGDRQGPRRVDQPPGQRGQRRQTQQPPQKPRGHPVGDSHSHGFFQCTAFHQPQDRGQARSLTYLRHAHRQRAVNVHRATGNDCADHFADWATFTGEQGFIHTGGAVDHNTVGGNLCARFDQNAVAHPQCRNEHTFDRALGALPAQTIGKGRRQTPQLFGRAQRLLASEQFQVTTAQQEKDEHVDRVVIDMPVSDECGPDAGHEGSADAQCHRGIHPYAA